LRAKSAEVFLKRYIKDYALLFSIAGLVVFFDQWTKNLVRNNLSLGESWMPLEWLAPYARIVHWHNTGAAFGMGQNLSWLFAGLAFVVIGAIIYYYPQVDRSNWLIRLALGMQMGGALGNLIDRLMQDMRVTDFVSVGTFAVWNIADASIFVGTIILIIGVWIEDRHQKQAEIETALAEEAALAEIEAAQQEDNSLEETAKEDPINFNLEEAQGE
jgi:signal peptidase II